jgi:hypothetical protein
MRAFVLGLFFSVAVLVPKLGIAQVYRLPTPAPQVTAVGTNWLASSSPIFYAGNYYYPTGPAIFFDGNVMSRTGNYMGVPLYEDSTLEPYSIVYVPIGNNLMRPYERRREGELAGTVGSRMPSFPIERDSEVLLRSGMTGISIPPLRGTAGAMEPEVLPEGYRAYLPPPGPVSQELRLSGAIDVRIIPPPAPPAPPAPARPGARGSAAAPAAPSSEGVWIEYGGSRYYSAGPSIGYDATRFETLGDYRGFPVYRETRGNRNRIYVAVLPDGPIAPFERR